jgi:hypothetical protein
MIVHGWKDIENRDWATRVRGRTLVHASKGMTKGEYCEACDLACHVRGNLDGFPEFEQLERGGIVGSVEIVDCVTNSSSRWFFGRFGFVLRAPEVLPFRAYRGQLGFFEVAE